MLNLVSYMGMIRTPDLVQTQRDFGKHVIWYHTEI